MSHNRLWLLIARQLSGEASGSETAELQALLKEHPDRQYFLDILDTYFNAHYADKTEFESTDSDFEEKFRKIVGEENENQDYSYDPLLAPIGHPKLTGLKKFWRYAAAISGISILGWLAYHSLKPNGTNENKVTKASVVVAKAGVRTKLLLPDGTQVWLNSGSKLNYQKDFNLISREVELEGEAFFDVVKDVNHPFIVHTSGINVKVLGTAFNVKSYPQDETIETTLLRGMIEVTRQDNPNAPKVILRPNEKLTFSRQISTLPVNTSASRPPAIKASPVIPVFLITPISKNIPDSEKPETSWVYNKLVFDGDSFRELAGKMERWYNVKIIFKTDDLFQYKFHYVIDKETIREALNALKLTAEFNYKINDNEIELSKK